MCALENSLQIFTILGSLASAYKTSLACKWTNVWLLFSLQFSSLQKFGIEVFGQPSAGVCVIATFICDDSDFSSSRCEYCGPGCQYSGTEEVGSGPSFETWGLYYIISFKLWIQDLVLQASQGPSFKVVVTWKTFPGRQVPAAGLYGALLTLIHHHIIHRPSFGRTIYSVYLDHYFWTIFSFRTIVVSAEVKDYNDLIQTASSSSSVRRQTW